MKVQMIHILLDENGTLFQELQRKKYLYNRTCIIANFLTQNWAMFVENILPSALSSFYFFDGEKIAELAVAKNR